MKGLLVIALLLVGIGVAQVSESELAELLVTLEEGLDEWQQRELAEELLVVKVSATELGRDYRLNEILARELYRGQVLEITGKIESIGSGRFMGLIGHVVKFIVSYAQTPDVECYFGRGHGEELSTLRVANSIRVRGRALGKIRNTIIIRDCELTSVQP